VLWPQTGQGRLFFSKKMALLTRQQAVQSWTEPDPALQFNELLDALERYKDIGTEYGLNHSVHQNWRFGDPHKKSGAPDRHDYDIKLSNGIEVSPGPKLHNLFRWRAKLLSSCPSRLCISSQTIATLWHARSKQRVEREDQVCWPIW
jgi:hypothetical protein